MNPAPDYDVEKVAAYAKEKGVYLISHNETGGNYLRFEAQLERSLDWAQSLGIHGLRDYHIDRNLRGHPHPPPRSGRRCGGFLFAGITGDFRIFAAAYVVAIGFCIRSAVGLL